MTIVNMRDVDGQMGRTIDPRSIPKHDGATQGAMEANFVAQSDTQVQDRGGGRTGAAVFDARDVGQEGYFGSGTIISLNEAPPLEAKMEPPLPKVPEVVIAAATKVVQVQKPTGSMVPDINALMARLKRQGA